MKNREKERDFFTWKFKEHLSEADLGRAIHQIEIVVVDSLRVKGKNVVVLHRRHFHCLVVGWIDDYGRLINVYLG